ncbi:uncharacterized protein LOC130673399 [Microplitis mediator]|uniref:uncharacterized protein LOC130673399 n=1 Tax=Microplitis mediator TaxID=375433 RepID=UPI0025553AFF|nr:uncharacterized protein LOC130673399 [Microplitis mediator]
MDRKYGVPTRITSDQGGQFRSSLFQSLSKLFGITHLLTTPYHPQSNGLVERQHRQLKAALLCHDDTWYDALPVVLLGLRAAWKEDIQATPAELVYGEPIRLLGELLVPSKKHANAESVLRDLKSFFNNLASAETSRHGERSVFCFRDLNTCFHVLVRVGQIGPSFSAPYEGLYEVVARHNKYFIVN